MLFKNDGSVPYGVPADLVIGSAAGGIGGTTYVAENINGTPNPVGRIVRKDRLGSPTGQVFFKNEADSFTCTLQWPTATSPQPVPGWETTAALFDTDGDGTLNSKVYILGEVGIPYVADQDTKINATFYEKLN